MYPAAILTVVFRTPPRAPSPAFAALFFSALMLAFLMLAAILSASNLAHAQTPAHFAVAAPQSEPAHATLK